MSLPVTLKGALTATACALRTFIATGSCCTVTAGTPRLSTPAFSMAMRSIDSPNCTLWSLRTKIALGSLGSNGSLRAGIARRSRWAYGTDRPY